MNVADTQDITVLSLCSGYGGLELGMAGALANPLRVVGVEIEAYALANLVAKAEEGKLAVEALWPDVRTFPAERFRGCFDFILAGYPCQPYSVAASCFKKERDDRIIWPFIRNCIEQVRPDYFFGENVAGHLSRGFDRVVYDLDGLGYKIEAGLFQASEVGGPHKRQRLFVLAHSDSNLLLRIKMQPKRMEKRYEKTSPESLLLPDWPPGPVTQSDIPRAIDGTPCPVDRIRLLGNGVVPQQAEKAFRYLWNKFVTPSSSATR